MVQNLWRGGGLRIVVARTCTWTWTSWTGCVYFDCAVFFAAEVWFKFRKVLQKWQKTARNVPVAPKQRTAPLSVLGRTAWNLPLCRRGPEAEG